jgi:hypothetical protein
LAGAASQLDGSGGDLGGSFAQIRNEDDAVGAFQQRIAQDVIDGYSISQLEGLIFEAWREREADAVRGTPRPVDKGGG